MPELPEVETVRRDLLPLVVGRTITSVYVSPDAPKLIQYPTTEEFARSLTGRCIVDISRRGKYLIFRLDNGHAWIVHLRMTGGLLHRSASAAADAYVRAVFALDDSSELRYRDPRKLGTMWLVADAEAVVGKLGPEPLDEGFTVHDLAQQLAKRAAPVKAVLLDQAVVAGLGNIYVDEALFLARVHPQRLAKDLTFEEIARLHQAIVCVLERGLGYRGTSFRFFVDAQGARGHHQERVMVFRRTGQLCYKCGTTIQRIKVGGRSTHFCPRCQSA